MQTYIHKHTMHTHTYHPQQTHTTHYTHTQRDAYHTHTHTHAHTHTPNTHTHTHTHTHNTHTPASGRHLLLAETVCCCQTASRAGWQKDSHTKHHSTVAEKGAPLHPCWCAEWEQREMGGGESKGRTGKGRECKRKREGREDMQYEHCWTIHITDTIHHLHLHLYASVTACNTIVHTASHQAALCACTLTRENL